MRAENWRQLSAMAIACALVLLMPVHAQERGAPPLAALVSDLTGTVTVRASGTGDARALQRFDALVPGNTLEVGRDSTCLVVLASGQRYELGPAARATLEATRLVRTSGPVTQLPAWPTLPRLAALDGTRPSGPPGGIRLRGDVVAGLRPSGTVTRAQQTVLSFQAVNGATRYKLVVEDEAGREVFAVEVSTTRTPVPPDVLTAGRPYYWTVETLDKVGAVARGSGRFTTLSPDAEQAREVLRRTVGTSNAPDTVALLAEIDRRLGLVEEALNGFAQALARDPGNARLRQLHDSLRDLPGAP